MRPGTHCGQCARARACPLLKMRVQLVEHLRHARCARALLPKKKQPRCGFFLEMSLVTNNVEVQKKGAVYIFYNMNPKRNAKDPPMIKNLALLRQSLPLRIASFHTCLPERKELTSVGFMINKDDIVRGISHYGKAFWGGFTFLYF